MSVSSSAVEGALLVRMRRTERELREIEGEVQRWKETLSRGTRNEHSSLLSSSDQEQKLLDELPALCAEALQVAMTLRRRAEIVRRSMSHIRNAAAEQSAARQGIRPPSNSSSGATPGGGGSTPGGTVQSPAGSRNNNSTFSSNSGSSALAYFVEDFVKSEFHMQEQAWWDVMTDIESVEALAVQLLSVPSSEMSSARVREGASMHQTKPADWTLENWDAAVTTSTGAALPAGMNSGLGRTGTVISGVGSPTTVIRPSPLAPSSLFSSFQSTPIPDLLLRRLQEQNRAKGLYTGKHDDDNMGAKNDDDGSSSPDKSNKNSSAYIGPIFASLAANPDVMSASDFDRLPKSDPLALFMSQMKTQLEEERKNRGQQPDQRFHGQDLPGGYDAEAAAAAGVPEPEYNVITPEQSKGPSDEEKQRAWEEQQRKDREAALKEAEELVARKRQAEEEEAADKLRMEQEAAAAAAEVEKKRQEEAAEEERKKKQLDDAKAEAAAAEKKLAEAEAEDVQKKEEKQQQQQQEQQQKKPAEEEKPAADEVAAATKIQAAQRGRNARKEVEKLKSSSAQPAGDESGNADATTAAAASATDSSDAAKPQEQDKKKPESASSAAQPEEEEETDRKQKEAAAIKIQAVQRGNTARKELEEKKRGTSADNEKSQEEEEQKQNDGDSSEKQDDDKKDSSAAPESAAADDAGDASAVNNAAGDEAAAAASGDGDATADAGGGVDPVAAALASGEWKEVKDPKGRTYFYHPASKKTTWDLAKELKKQAGAACKHGKK